MGDFMEESPFRESGSTEDQARSEAKEQYKDRGFQRLEDAISGRSVVFERERESAEKAERSELWPYSLPDYLKGYIGKTVLVRYSLANNRCCEKRGRLAVVGTNFIGLQTERPESHFLIEISYIVSIDIIGSGACAEGRQNGCC